MRVRDFPVSLNKTQSMLCISNHNPQRLSPDQSGGRRTQSKGLRLVRACLLEKAAALNAPKACKSPMALFDFHR